MSIVLCSMPSASADVVIVVDVLIVVDVIYCFFFAFSELGQLNDYTIHEQCEACYYVLLLFKGYSR